MSYKSNVRIVTTNEGYESLRGFCTNKEYIYENTDDIYYIGYNNLNIEELDKFDSIIREFPKNNITYRKVAIGEETNDIVEDSYTAINDQNKNIPYIYIKRQFDDEELFGELQKIKNQDNTVKKYSQKNKDVIKYTRV